MCYLPVAVSDEERGKRGPREENRGQKAKEIVGGEAATDGRGGAAGESRDRSYIKS